ncbi:dihydrolipoyl dehydrogenase (plasmid) [Halorussus limi]|uniref:Dihydrolipoyl dehydrogenase n=1 Tax=Halorussus limi TaxID=2938695 RepID=A0A8U0I0L5_9EURY|nr:dihydrolipoyl dehydrogenase [Halorussus limi]UPV76915.1 dihydrolipoyl dehydrogenase [Halorussus limi]
MQEGQLTEFDVVVIGAGSGLSVASAAARQGADVAVIEKGLMGGTCLNRGCVPSKMLIHRADIAEQIRQSEQFGIEAEITNVDFASMVEEVNADVEESATQIEHGLRQSPNHTLFKDEAQFVDTRTLKVNGNQIIGHKVIVAAGTRPFIPPIDGIEDVDYITSTGALQRDTRPNHLVIVGGGYIAAELAHFYGSFGTDITIIGRADTLLPEEDREIAERFTRGFADKHTVYTSYEAIAAAQQNGEITVTAEHADGEVIDIAGDELLIAAGRIPNTDTLAVENAGIETDPLGFVETNEYLETTAQNVWALGDIVGEYLYKHSANLEAQYVVQNAFGEHDHKHPVDYAAMPHAVFSSPQVAGVGMTEEELEEENMEYISGKYSYEDTAMGGALKETEGIVKVLVDPSDGAILGCHILGPRASMLIHEVVVAMTQGSGTVVDIADSTHVHPALNEVVQRAFRSV